jgi:hypothetical protein
MNGLSAEDKNFLEREHTHKWPQPWQLYFLTCKFLILIMAGRPRRPVLLPMSIVLLGPETLILSSAVCALAAAVQGMDETVDNGAQALYLEQLNITTKRFFPNMVDNLTGLVVGSPYLACAILGCWLTEPLNRGLLEEGLYLLLALLRRWRRCDRVWPTPGSTFSWPVLSLDLALDRNRQSSLFMLPNARLPLSEERL